MANDLIVTVQDTSLTLASTNLNNPVIIETMDNIGDVDLTTNGKVNGSVLVYNTTTNKWTATTTLDAQNMEAGEF
jgi:hypothetical protein